MKGAGRFEGVQMREIERNKMSSRRLHNSKVYHYESDVQAQEMFGTRRHNAEGAKRNKQHQGCCILVISVGNSGLLAFVTVIWVLVHYTFHPAATLRGVVHATADVRHISRTKDLSTLNEFR